MKKLSYVWVALVLVLVFVPICYADSYETENEEQMFEPNSSVSYNFVGIWQMAGQQFFVSVHVKGSTIVGVTYIPGGGESCLLGTISGNIGHINYASDLAQFDATFTFTSATTGTLTVNKCVPFSGEYCIFPAGTTINGVKIF